VNWAERAREAIAQAHGQIPEDCPFKERKAAIKAAYPFGERAYWPYKAWCNAQRAYLSRYDPKAPKPALFRDVMAARGDIIFPFAKSDEA
jgi:hypothetical protein